MKNTFKSLLLVSALTLPLAGFAADGDSIGTKVEDAVITVKVETDSNGLVQLSGVVKSKAEADKAVLLAKNVKGVTAVKDDIVVAQ